MFTADVIILVLYCFTPPVTLFLGWDSKTLTKSLWGLLSWFFFLVGQLGSNQITFGPLHHPKIHHRDNIDGIPLNAKSEWGLAEMRWYKCIYTILPMKMVYKHDISWNKCTDQPTHPGWRVGWYLLIVQNCSTSMEVGSVLHTCHIWVEQVGPNYPEMSCLSCLMLPFQTAQSWQAHCLWMVLGLMFSFAQPPPLVCHSWPALSWDWWEASSFYAVSSCIPPHPFSIPHRMVNRNRASFLFFHQSYILCWPLTAVMQTRTMSPTSKAAALLHLS